MRGLLGTEMVVAETAWTPEGVRIPGAVVARIPEGRTPGAVLGRIPEGRTAEAVVGRTPEDRIPWAGLARRL